MLDSGHPALAPTADLAPARAIVAGYEPPSEEQAGARRRILQFLDSHPDALDRSCAPGHLTGSAALLDATGRHVILTLHRKYRRWLQVGGHCDGDGNLAGTALREAEEESGMSALRIAPAPVDLDIHAVPCPPGVAGQHLDVRFLVVAPTGARPAAGHESIEVAWFPVDALPDDLDEGGRRLVRAAVAAFSALRRRA